MAILTFGDWELDDELPELRHAGRPVEVPSKALELLLHLARNRHRMVSRSELHERLWPDRAVSDSALKHWLRSARRAVGDSGPRHHVIKTQHKLGLRFVAPVLEREASNATAEAPASRGNEEPLLLLERGIDLQRLEQALMRAAGGAGGIGLVGGEPGIGKSRLVRELAAVGRRRGIRFHVGRGLPDAGGEALWPWRQIFEDVIREHPRAELEDALGTLAAELVPLVPELAAKLAITPSRAGATAEEARFRVFRAVSGLLLRLPGPRAVVFEDLQWYDDESLFLLESLLPELACSRVLFVLTYRDEEVPEGSLLRSTLVRLVRSAGALDFHLGGLSAAGVAELIRLCSGRSAETAVAEALRARAGGNPLFVQELLRWQADGVAAPSPGEGAGGLPPAVEQILGRRVRRLSAPTRELLAVAVLAGEFSPALLGWTSRLPMDAVMSALEEASNARLVQEIPGQRGRYRFATGLAGEVLIAELDPVRRAELHRRVGEALEALHAEDLDAHLGALAHHFGEALPVGSADKALAYARRAERLEVERGRHEEAERHHARALAAEEAARARR